MRCILNFLHTEEGICSEHVFSCVDVSPCIEMPPPRRDMVTAMVYASANASKLLQTICRVEIAFLHQKFDAITTHAGR